MIAVKILHTLSVAIAIILGGLGSGIGQGIAGLGTLQGMARQSESTQHILRTMILGLALIESGLVLALVVALMLLFGGVPATTLAIGFAELGMGLAIGLSALAISIPSSFAVKATCESIGRQPFFTQKLLILMLVSQSIIGAPGIFAFIVALLIKTKIGPDMAIVDGLKLLAAGVTIGVGSIGPSIGQGIFASASCKAAGLNTKSFGKLFSFSLLSQAIIQTPLIFCLVISMITIFKPVAGLSAATPLLAAATFFTPAFAMSIGSLGPAIALGYAASTGCKYIVRKPESYTLILRTSLLAQAIIESAAIYALIVTLILMTKRFV